MIKTILIFLVSPIILLAQKHNDFESYLLNLSEKFEVEQITADSIVQKDLILLDTREKEEYDVSHIKNALWVGYDDFKPARVDSFSRDAEIIVYCSVGYRSSVIAEKLKEAGFKNVKNLYGGIFNWANEGRAIVNDSTETNKIHCYNNKWGKFVNNLKLEKIY